MAPEIPEAIKYQREAANRTVANSVRIDAALATLKLVDFKGNESCQKAVDDMVEQLRSILVDTQMEIQYFTYL